MKSFSIIDFSLKFDKIIAISRLNKNHRNACWVMWPSCLGAALNYKLYYIVLLLIRYEQNISKCMWLNNWQLPRSKPLVSWTQREEQRVFFFHSLFFTLISFLLCFPTNSPLVRTFLLNKSLHVNISFICTKLPELQPHENSQKIDLRWQVRC